jgi:hypothetical protein
MIYYLNKLTMKKIFCFCLLIASAIYCSAQNDGPVKPSKDSLQFMGYTIRIIPAEQRTYGYDIFHGNRLILHQQRNPFTSSPCGLHKKQDVFDVAKWQIEHIFLANPTRALPIRPVPQNVAQELQIETH